jgi:hypothetical protein
MVDNDQQAQIVSDKTTTMSTLKLQNRIEDTGIAITGMVVTDDDHLLLCDHHPFNCKLVAVYYPSGKYMKRIDVSYRPWESFSVLWVMMWSIILLTVTSPNFLMDEHKSFDSSKESVTRFNSDVVVCNSLSA